MTEMWITCPDDAAVRCDDCGWTGLGADLELIRDLEARIEAGEQVPAGQCACGALAHLVDEPDSRVVDMRNVLQAVLLFHSPSPWDREKQGRWRALMGQRPEHSECTAKALCDRVREVLGIGG